jgi:hypothetical protein
MAFWVDIRYSSCVFSGDPFFGLDIAAPFLFTPWDSHELEGRGCPRPTRGEHVCTSEEWMFCGVGGRRAAEEARKGLLGCHVKHFT